MAFLRKLYKEDLRQFAITKEATIKNAAGTDETGLHYLREDGVGKDEKKAFEYFKKAADMGDASAISHIDKAMQLWVKQILDSKMILTKAIIKEKDRACITVMLATNAAGTKKLKPLVIGLSIEPRALVCLNYDALPVTYHLNLKAWMQIDIFFDSARYHYNPNDDSGQGTLEQDEELCSNEESSKKSESEEFEDEEFESKELESEELEDEELESEELEDEELEGEELEEASSSKTLHTQQGCSRLNASNINKQKGQDSPCFCGCGCGFGRARGHACGHAHGQVSQHSKGRHSTGRPYKIPDFSDIRLTNIQIDDIEELIIDLTTNLLDTTIKRQLNEFNQINDAPVLTEDVLSEEQIVNFLLDEQWELEEGDTSDTYEEPP
ncbi:hypothetical protein C2G38_2151842 [Gigaspora rosea]|uniref:DDE-1 domain-containing protein n=1 Tax=Gigaspora rosea TaxID=44941 RepID=A0A397WAC5_9GLOM|nr:hypothetical protein C2G38_2151842 [Gigaspora rosea]